MARSARLERILSLYSEGPQTGVFTDGGSQPNPGPGGWGVVHVVEGSIVHEASGHDPDTTNNRMELTALIQAYTLLPENADITVFSDSEICVKTVNEWAKAWEKRGWRRSSGPIKNLELVQELYRLSLKHPKVKLSWLKAHNGWKWNEYADTLSTEWAHQF